MNKSYLGDGVYVEEDHGMLKLTTEDGIEVTNTIYLEWPVYESLKAYVAMLEIEIAAQSAVSARSDVRD